MYGMINQAILEYLDENFGPDASDAVLTRAACEEKQFAALTQYADEVSYALIGAAAEVLDQPAADVLENVGEYWVGFALRSPHADLLRMAGRTLSEVLQNLDHLHTRIGPSFKQMEPPSFWCDDVTENTLVLNYASERAGLGPMVAGLVRGLGNMLGYSTRTEPVANEPGKPMKFLVQFTANEEAQTSPGQSPASGENSGSRVKSAEALRTGGSGKHIRS